MEQLMSSTSAFDESVAAYRPISWVAVAAAVAGVASVAALLHPVLWFIPGLALLLGVVALVRLNARSGVPCTGKGMACLGIWCSLFFAAWVLSDYSLSRYFIARQSRIAADRWLQMIQHHALWHAHQWVLSYASRVNPGEPLNEYYKPGSENEKPFRRFFDSEPAKTLAAVEPGDRFVYLGCEEVLCDRLSCYVTLRYRLEFASAEQRPPLEFFVIMKRFKEPETYDKSWQVQGVSPVEPATLRVMVWHVPCPVATTGSSRPAAYVELWPFTDCPWFLIIIVILTRIIHPRVGEI